MFRGAWSGQGNVDVYASWWEKDLSVSTSFSPCAYSLSSTSIYTPSVTNQRGSSQIQSIANPCERLGSPNAKICGAASLPHRLTSTSSPPHIGIVYDSIRHAPRPKKAEKQLEREKAPRLALYVATRAAASSKSLIVFTEALVRDLNYDRSQSFSDMVSNTNIYFGLPPEVQNRNQAIVRPPTA